MAEIQTSTPGKQKGVKRITKKSTRVDLTPMVDLGFLLITFFVFTTTMAKPVVMEIKQPNDTGGWDSPVCESCVLTVLLDKEDKIKYYEGNASTAVLKETDFSVDGIRKIISEKKEKVAKEVGSAGRMVLIIKPTDVSHFKNFVDIADEVIINSVGIYYLDEVKPEDKKLLGLN